MAVGPVSNWISKRYGFRASMITGAIMLAGGQILAGFAKKIWQLFLTQGVLFGFGLGFVSCPLLAAVSWYAGPSCYSPSKRICSQLTDIGFLQIMVSTSPIAAQWFGRRRALALGIGGAGSGAGGLIFSNVTRIMIEKHGLKWAFLLK